MIPDFSEEAIMRNLVDGGFDSIQVETFIAKLHQGQQKECIEDLTVHRDSLLEEIHTHQKNIISLDEILDEFST